jgi:hypothetical protein
VTDEVYTELASYNNHNQRFFCDGKTAQCTSTCSEGDALDGYYKFRTHEKQILFVAFTPTTLLQYEITISTYHFYYF